MTERRPSRRAVIASALAIGVVAVLGAVAFVPRTVAEGGVADAIADDRWQVRVAPGLLSARVRLSTVTDAVELTSLGRPPVALGDTEVVLLEAPTTTYTVIVGPTPRGTTSVRHDTDLRGPGEAQVVRVGWRRLHVAVLPGPLEVEELTAIGPRGQVEAVVRGLAPLDRSAAD